MESYVYFVVVVFIAIIASIKISSVYSRYKEDNKKKLSGFEVARKILDNNDLKDMYIVEVRGTSNDYYDYSHKVIKLSTDIFHGETITAGAVAAFYSTQAVLDKKGNKFFQFRASLGPIIKMLTYISYILFIAGICLNDANVCVISAALVFIIFLFHISTLKLDLEIRKGAKYYLENYDLFEKDELENVSAVLSVIVFNTIASIVTLIVDIVKQAIYSINKKN